MPNFGRMINKIQLLKKDFNNRFWRNLGLKAEIDLMPDFSS